MVKICFVKACPFNTLEAKDKTRYSLHSFPDPKKLPSTYHKWLSFCKIPASMAEIHIHNNSRICSRHFYPCCYSSQKTLIKGSFPALFGPTTPSGTEISCIPFASEEEVSANLIASSTHPRQKQVSFSDLKAFSFSFASNRPSFSCRDVLDGFLLYIQEEQAPFRNIVSIFVRSDKSVSFYSFGKEVSRSNYSQFFQKKYFVTSLSDFSSLLKHIHENYSNFQCDKEFDCPFEKLRDQFSCHSLIDFFEEQISLHHTEPSGRRYSPETIMFCFMILCKSRSALLTLSEVFILPSFRLLRRYSSSIGDSLKSDEKNFEYFSKQCAALLPHERDITVKYDEVQTKSKLEFRSGEIYGFAANRDNEIANHLQCFMIRSMKGKYREMV